MGANADLNQRFYDEVFGAGNIEVIDELLDPAFVEHEELPPGFSQDRNGVRAFFGMLLEAFSDHGGDLELVDEVEDRVWSIGTFSGTTPVTSWASRPRTSRCGSPRSTASGSRTGRSWSTGA